MSNPVAPSKSFSPWARRRARRALLQALYAWQVAGADLADLRMQFSTAGAPAGAPTGALRPLSGGQMRGVDEDFFLDCLSGVVHGTAAIDSLFLAYLDRAIDALDHVERAILRAGVFELKERLDVPAPVVIDEWVELAKTFGAEESFRYINGVLDRVAQDVRRVELAAR